MMLVMFCIPWSIDLFVHNLAGGQAAGRHHPSRIKVSSPAGPALGSRENIFVGRRVAMAENSGLGSGHARGPVDTSAATGTLCAARPGQLAAAPGFGPDLPWRRATSV